MKKLTLLFLLLFFNDLKGISEIENINTPTSDIIDYGVGSLFLRMYSNGGIITRFVFAPFNRLNFGGTIDICEVIGFQTPKLKEPTFYFKWRIFDGSKYLPALALGYDGQPYSFISNSLPAKGLFLVFSYNIGLQGLFWDFGVNFTEYMQDNELFAFTSLRILIEDIVGFTIEYENIPRAIITQLNCKLTFVLTKIVWVDFIFNKLNSDDNHIERQIKVTYLYRFY
ncbi:MAG: hypothetical protein N2643_02065 [Endomicrobia bacterium]|nr:hypothetical protein [Endomicrobiia bacterium]